MDLFCYDKRDMYLFACMYKLLFEMWWFHQKTAFYKITVLWPSAHFGILFGSKYDLAIFLQNKSATVCLFHQFQIKLVI